MGRVCCVKVPPLVAAPRSSASSALVVSLLLAGVSCSVLVAVNASPTSPISSSSSSNSLSSSSYSEAGAQLSARQLDQLYRQQQLQRLKQRILEGLGLTKVPDVSKMNVSREEYERMYRVYLRSVEEQREREHAEAQASPHVSTSRPYTPAQRFYSFSHAPSLAPSAVRQIVQRRERRQRRRKVAVRGDTEWLYFPLEVSNDDVKTSSVSAASLRFLLAWPDSSSSAPRPRQTITLRVYQVLRPDEDLGEPERLLIDQKEVLDEIETGAGSTRWLELDVRRAAETWLRDPSSNLGLELQCRGCQALGATLDTQEHPGSSTLGPALSLLTEVGDRERSSSRGRRSIDLGAPQLRRTNCSSSGERCCRHSMEVVFKELEDFDFILQPPKYDAGYCKGRCPPRYNPASHHAFLQSLVWKRDRSLAPRPCCAPSKLKSLQMLVLDADDTSKLRVESWTEMEVEECACS